MKSRTIFRIFFLLSAILALGVSAAAAQDAEPDPPNFVFRLEPAIDTLVADGQSETTLLAFLSTNDGRGIDGERVRFVLSQGRGFLRAPEALEEVEEFLGEEPEMAEEVLDPEATVVPDEGMIEAEPEVAEELGIALDALNIGNGVYVARLRAGEVAGTITVTAQWLTAPETIPTTSTSVRAVTADQLSVEVDDPLLLADGEDTATVVAYVLDELNRPVPNANVTFRILNGSGTITPLDSPEAEDYGTIIDGTFGRYAAVFQSSRTPGQVELEVALPTITNPIRRTVNIDVVEASVLSAVAFPQQVGRRLNESSIEQENISTILVAVRDGEGDLVPGLSARQLEARVITGPGDLMGPEEIEYPDGSGSGVYQFEFVASQTTGSSVIRIINLESPNEPSAEVTIETLTDVNPSVLAQAEMRVFPDEQPYYADGEGRALVVTFVADEDGNAHRPDSAITSDFLVIAGQGSLSGSGGQLTTLHEAEMGTGIHTVTYTAGSSNVETSADIRAVFTASDGQVVSQTTSIDLAALGPPKVVVFPNPIPANRLGRVVVDVFDFDDTMVGMLRDRYLADVEAGPGTIVQSATNGGRFPDLVPNDHLTSALYEISETAGASQQVQISVLDEAVAGFPTALADLQIGQATSLRAVVSPAVSDPGDPVQIVVFAQDEFGLPALDHELVLTVVDGSASVLEAGRMIDDGGEIAGFVDAFPNDGAYTGAIESTGVASGTVTVRVTDLTPPNQPTVDIQITITG